MAFRRGVRKFKRIVNRVKKFSRTRTGRTLRTVGRIALARRVGPALGALAYRSLARRQAAQAQVATTAYLRRAAFRARTRTY